MFCVFLFSNTSRQVIDSSNTVEHNTFSAPLHMLLSYHTLHYPIRESRSSHNPHLPTLNKEDVVTPPQTSARADGPDKSSSGASLTPHPLRRHRPPNRPRTPLQSQHVAESKGEFLFAARPGRRHESGTKTRGFREVRVTEGPASLVASRHRAGPSEQ